MTYLSNYEVTPSGGIIREYYRFENNGELTRKGADSTAKYKLIDENTIQSTDYVNGDILKYVKISDETPDNSNGEPPVHTPKESSNNSTEKNACVVGSLWKR